MQVVQTLKFAYDTTLNPEIDKAVEDLVFLIHKTGGMITDGIAPNRGGSTIVNRPSQTKTYDNGDWPGKISYDPKPEKKSRFIGSDLGSTGKSG
jgi:hypothetical protein